MAGSVNKDELRRLYEVERKSIPQIAALYGAPRSRIRQCLIDAGVVLRSRAEGVRLAGYRLSAIRRGKARTFTEEWKANIRSARLAWGEQNARGVSQKASGYIVVTRGADKDRGQHVVLMEQRIGRRLLPDEVVHHIDENRANNATNNLALMTRSAHTRLHRLQQARGVN